MFWLTLLAFGLPLYWYIRMIRKDKTARERRLQEIQQRLEEKRTEAINDKVDSFKASAKQALESSKKQ